VTIGSNRYAVPTFIQRVCNTGVSGAVNTVAFPSLTTAGSTVIALISFQGLDAGVSIGDSQGNTYLPAHPIVRDAASSHSYQTWYAPAVDAGVNSITATLSATSANSKLYIHEYGGLEGARV